MKNKDQLEEFNSKDLMCEAAKPESSPRISSSDPLYSKWMDRLARSLVMLWEAAESKKNVFSLPVDMVTQFAVGSTVYNLGQDFAMWPTCLKSWLQG